MILAGDVGGTKVLLALVERAGGGLRVVAERRYESGRHDGFSPIMRDFLDREGERPASAAFGVAGPVVGGRAELTNLGWTLDVDTLATELGARVELLNDLVATAHGLSDLADRQVVVLHDGRPTGPTEALVAAGTGLGMAIMTEIGGRRVVLPSEGGHMSFAPRDAEEQALLAWLRDKHGNVSVERVVSGLGIEAIYEFLRESGRVVASPALARRIEAASDQAVAISAAALEGGAPICEATMARFVAAYGAVAGDMALVAHALGGVWIGGGIAPDILPLLETGAFLKAFRAKGRLRDLLESVPVKVVLEERVALLGAARYAADRL
jgi:glucokinase